MKIVIIVLSVSALFGAAICSAFFLLIAMIEERDTEEKNDLQEVINEINETIF